MSQKIPFLKLFSAWTPGEMLAELAEKLLVTQAVIDKSARSIRAVVECASLPLPAEQEALERSIALAYRVERVALEFQPKEPPAKIERIAAAETPEPAPVPVEEDPFARTEALRREALKKLKVAQPAGKKAGSKTKGKLIYGRHEVKKDPFPMGSLELDMGTVVVEGDVFAVDHRELKKRGAWVVCFDMTDYTGSVRVSKFFPGDEGKCMYRAS